MFLEVPCHFLGSLELQKRGSMSIHKKESTKVEVSGYKMPSKGLRKNVGFHHSSSQQRCFLGKCCHSVIILILFFF